MKFEFLCAWLINKLLIFITQELGLASNIVALSDDKIWISHNYLANVQVALFLFEQPVIEVWSDLKGDWHLSHWS